MSRIGNKVITLPAGVEVNNKDNVVTVKGPKGELTREFNKNIEIKIEGNEVSLHRPNDSKEMKTIHGTSRANLNNTGSVFFLAGGLGGNVSRTIEVPAGKTLFFPVLNNVYVFTPETSEDCDGVPNPVSCALPCASRTRRKRPAKS